MNNQREIIEEHIKDHLFGEGREKRTNAELKGLLKI